MYIAITLLHTIILINFDLNIHQLLTAIATTSSIFNPAGFSNASGLLPTLASELLSFFC